MIPGHCVHCFNCRSVQKGQGGRNVGCDWVLPKERQASSAFFFTSRGNQDDLVHVMSPLLSTAVKAVTGESFRTRPHSCSMTRSVFLHCPSVWGELHFLNSLWEGDQVVDLRLLHVVLSVIFNSMWRCDVINDILMRTNAMWDQACLCLMQCFAVIFLCTESWIMLHWYLVCCDNWRDDGFWWEKQRLCKCKALPYVCQCLFKLYASLPDVTCYSNCMCVWKWICKKT